MIEIEIAHSHGADEASNRVRAAAERLDVQAVDPSATAGHSGAMRKDTPLGSVVAEWVATASSVTVTVTKKPGFVPEGTIRRMLEDGLKEALA
ncbi:MAG: hypothetical protein ACI8QS_000044 [Planctomycetota bacterium]|jgi:hypothetical protein